MTMDFYHMSPTGRVSRQISTLEEL